MTERTPAGAQWVDTLTEDEACKIVAQGMDVMRRQSAEIARLHAEVARLRKDAARLDWLEAQARGYHDVAIHSDHEDGVWIAKLERGWFHTTPIEHRDEHPTLRAAIDAASVEPHGAARRLMEEG